MIKMFNCNVLDCTLREAPLEQLMWGDLAIRKMISGLEKAGVDIIEVGFLKNDINIFGSTSFQKVEQIEPYINKSSGSKYVALVDFGRYDLSNLSEFNGKSIDAIRVCFKRQEIEYILDYAQKIKDKGYQVCIQHVDTLGYSDKEIRDFIIQINRFKPLAYSIVDTFGAMYQDDLIHYCKLIDEVLNPEICLGFHGHNNLMLADANAQCFLNEMNERRDIIVDSSLFGCGRGAGNAHTELVLQFMLKKLGKEYNINEILDLMDTVICKIQKRTNWGYSIPYFISGMHNTHSFNVKYLTKRHNISSKDLQEIIEQLDDKQKKTYNYALLEKIYVEHFNKSVNDSEIIEKLASLWSGRPIMLLAPGKSIIEERAAIDQFIIENNPIIIDVNNLIDGFKQDYIFFSSVKRYENLQFYNYEGSSSIHIILSSNIKTKPKENEMIVNYMSLIKFGWINIDSSIILLLRLLIRCAVKEVYIAGLDGYKDAGETFYNNELEMGLADEERRLQLQENYSMIQDLENNFPEFRIFFITNSVYDNTTREICNGD